MCCSVFPIYLWKYAYKKEPESWHGTLWAAEDLSTPLATSDTPTDGSPVEPPPHVSVGPWDECQPSFDSFKAVFLARRVHSDAFSMVLLKGMTDWNGWFPSLRWRFRAELHYFPVVRCDCWKKFERKPIFGHLNVIEVEKSTLTLG